MQPATDEVPSTVNILPDQPSVPQMPRLMEETPDNSTTIYYWQGKSWTDFGHVSMLVKSNGRAGVYVSFTTVHTYSPLSLFFCCSGTAGTFLGRRASEHRDCDSKVTITGLDHALVYDAAVERINNFKERCKRVIDMEDNESAGGISGAPPDRESTEWGIWGGRMTCASVVLDLLIAGGLKSRMPVYGNLRENMENFTRLVSHVTLLSLRPMFPLFALMPLSYSLISGETPGMSDFAQKIFFSGLLSAGIIATFLFEKYAVPRFDVPKSSAFRGRELVEINPFSDSFIALLASMSMGVNALFYRFHPLEDAFSGTLEKEWLILADAFLWLLVSGFVYLGVGTISAVMLGCLNGRFVKTPNFIYRLSRYLSVFDGVVDTRLIEQQFRKEKTLLFLNALTLPTVFIAHCYDDELLHQHTGNYKLQIIGAAVLLAAYLITKGRITYFEWQDKKLAKKKRIEGAQIVLDESVQALLSSNEPKPELFCASVIFPGLVQLVGAYKLSAVMDNALAAFLTSVMVFLTYAIVIFAYSAAYHPVKKYFPCCFFEPETASEMRRSMQESGIEEEESRHLLLDESRNVAVIS